MKSNTKWPAFAKLWIQRQKLDAQIAALREKQRALLSGKMGYSSGFGEDDSRADLTLDVPVAEYLAQFPDAENLCTLRTYETDRQLPNGIREEPCVASYMSWPAKHVCSVAFGKKPLHLWIRAHSQTTYAPKAAAAIEVNPAAVATGETAAA